ncbi:MAG TPA: hypothetical protein VGB30_08705 [bacterium]|jgi:hypothetical protein
MENAEFNLEDTTLFSVENLSVTYEGKSYTIDHESVVDAFQKAPLGDFAGPHQRFYIRIEDDMKSSINVFSQIVPVDKELIGNSEAGKIAGLFRTLGFEILDSRIHHSK